MQPVLHVLIGLRSMLEGFARSYQIIECIDIIADHKSLARIHKRPERARAISP